MPSDISSIVSAPSGHTVARRIPTDLAVHIRLRRVGKTKAPTYRVVIADSSAPRNGKFIESIGHYNPRSEPADLLVNADRARNWIKNGTRPTASARSLLVRSRLPAARDTPTLR